MVRYESIDFMKGVAVILMIIFHIFYFPHQYGFREFNFNTIPLTITARVAQIIFITCVGINMYISYNNYLKKNKNNTKYDFYKKYAIRLLKLGGYAVLISLFSYFIFGYKFVKFGILHFITASSFLLLLFIDKQVALTIIISGILLLKYFNNKKPGILLRKSPKTAFITGIYSVYPTVDHFPFIPWIALISGGLLAGKYIVNTQFKESNTYNKIKNNFIFKNIEWTGKHSLEIYMIHWVLLYIFFAHIYKRFRSINHV
jgi:uncharacterized membrane protein